MFSKTPVFATLLALTLITSLTLVTTRGVSAAPPSDGVYDIAVLEVGDAFDWNDDGDDFQALAASEYDWEKIQPNDLTPSVLDGFDVLIIPWNHEYGWLTSGMADAIMDFIDSGGTLIIHSVYVCDEICEVALPEGTADALLAYFPNEYAIDWSSAFADTSSESVLIINPSHPLASRPNVLTPEGLSGWDNSIHSFVVDWGSAWQWVLATDFASVRNDDGEGPLVTRARQSAGELSTQDIEPGIDVAMLQACAPFGAGVIVVSGQDPEFHGTNDDEAEAYLQIENEIKLGAVGCGTDKPRDRGELQRQQPPNIGAGLSGLFNGMPTPLPTAPSAVAPASTSPVITPPRTGDAGLADKTPLTAAIAGTGIVVLATFILSLKLSRR